MTPGQRLILGQICQEGKTNNQVVLQFPPITLTVLQAIFCGCSWSMMLQRQLLCFNSNVHGCNGLNDDTSMCAVSWCCGFRRRRRRTLAVCVHCCPSSSTPSRQTQVRDTYATVSVSPSNFDIPSLSLTHVSYLCMRTCALIVRRSGVICTVTWHPKLAIT